ncbi:TPA: hypothetical protein QDZ99_003121 [Stenotrophomonas maltophilia]|nr:hypothetical protein [Stenotrophomonas maltophilia]HDS1158335.1 hypothetical protein [Stenotrophomonas maltophilia]HDS1165655.1 hypothetical protein [Stenotrophomonas maltophilia]HDS1171385.1 hypothetical protein [Stenotrophomonas maltophilia]HDS1174720.1 hypothetical protein [Stenotrophomonas maltophilia]
MIGLVKTIYHLILISVVLGGFFSRTTLTTPASIVREACIWLLVLALLAKGPSPRLGLSGFARWAFLCLFMSFSIGLITTGLYDLDVRTISDKWAVLYKFFQIFILAACFAGYRRLTGNNLGALVKWFVIYLSVYAMVSPIIYFNPPPIMIENFRWWGRFGVGYPTMDAQLFTFGVVAILFGGIFRGLLRALVLALCLWGILIQVTATGFVTIIAVFGMYAALHARSAWRSIPSVAAVTTIGLVAMYAFGQEVTGTAVDLFWTKVDNLLGTNAEVNTLDIREDQFVSLIYMLRGDGLANWLGVGVGIYVENQYGFSRIAFGVVGLAVLIGSLVLLAAEGIRRRRLDGGVLLASVVVFSLACYTLTVFYLFPLTCAMAMLMLYSEELKGSGSGRAGRERQLFERSGVSADSASDRDLT